VKVLLDENLPHRLRSALEGHEAATVAFMGWASIKNGELLTLAEANGFDVFLTADRNLPYQQNLTNRDIAVVSLTALDWEIIQPYVAEIIAAISSAKPGTAQQVECGEFKR